MLSVMVVEAGELGEILARRTATRDVGTQCGQRLSSRRLSDPASGRQAARAGALRCGSVERTDGHCSSIDVVTVICPASRR